MEYARHGDLIAVHLKPGERVMEKFKQLAEEAGIRAGFILGGIGMLREIELGYFVGEGKYETKTFSGPHELLVLHGNLSRYQDSPLPHIHAIFGKEDYSTFGGHLVDAVVEITLEVSILDLTGSVSMVRHLDERFKLPELWVGIRD